MITTVAQAQQVRKRWGRELISGIKSLQIGDKVPDIRIGKIINSDVSSAEMSSFADGLLILDFWDTSCSACIENMPKLDSLQRKFLKRKVNILSVTWQNEGDVVSFFSSNRFLTQQKKPVRLATIVEDRILGSYFKHNGVPHVVWINKGVVIAITDQFYVNETNIQKIIDGKSLDWPVKNDHFDTGMQLIFGQSDLLAQISKFSYSILTGQMTTVSEIGGLNYIQDSIINHTSRIAIFNQPIVQAYRIISMNSEKVPRKFILTPGRLVLEVLDSSKYVYEPKNELDDWNKNNRICYEMVVKGRVEQSVMAKMALKDLDNKLGIHGRWEKRKTKCLVIIKITDHPKIKLQESSRKATISEIVLLDLDLTGKYPPAIDETDFTGRVNIQSYNGNLEELRKQLKQQGFNIIEDVRDIDVLVITENDWKKSKN